MNSAHAIVMIPSLLLGKDTHRDLETLLEKDGGLTISGASNETAKALLTSHLLDLNHRKSFLVTDTEESADNLCHWLRFFGQDARSLRPVEDANRILRHEYLQSFILAMKSSETPIFLMNRSTWEAEFPSIDELEERKILLSVGDSINFTKFFESLIERGYNHGDDLYLNPGEYRRIGETLDLHPIQSAHSYRVQFDFEKIRKILAVDQDDLSKTAETPGTPLIIYPATFKKRATLCEQFPAKTLLILDDQEEITVPKTIPSLSFATFPEHTAHHVHLRYLSVLKFYTLTDFLNDVRDKLAQKWTLLIVTKRMKELEKILQEERIPHDTGGIRREGAITLIHADKEDLLPHSLQNPDLRCAMLTDREIFSLRKAGKQRSMTKLALDFITSLQPGDYVVHMEHGIGHFEGMTQKTIDNVSREYLELTYAEGDKLFIPVDQADKLSKFVHEEGEDPVLTRLGTTEWKRINEKLRAETKEIAKELLNLYAKRAKAKGHSFPDDGERQRKFEEAFQYTETPGQLKAIVDIKRDMESEHSMDRLVCGDVGFGKTEVAMRAAFKAVEAGRQVAVIAPITILVDQHYRNFVERMSPFKIQIDMMSRFRSVQEQRKTLDRLRKGDVQIVIGTHRLLQDDVRFHNLGLVIIDEEQRFGVKQKEKFKEMRASVDILTLTATPIPRTLNLGLHKLRDITTITTPPPGRLPIITEVRKYSDELMRQAILAEKKRKGQCFVLHNSVETIDAFAHKLQALVPEASFVVGHGQLKAETLEKRIIAFKDHKCDVLVSSTIIENGIDLPRANTIIVNEAERFGLSQLYQLRGRVGRSKVQAYAYFLYHSQKLKDDAKKRLRAIVEACELGSGFQVAMRDLEIRGAGEILGANQSGTMQTVGVSHYLRLLKNAVEELRTGEKDATEGEDIAVEIQLPVEALIPSFYITDDEEKISVYQKLAGSENEEILKEFETDLREEFGALPAQVRSLFQILRLKMACRRAGVIRVKAGDSSTDLRGERISAEIVLTLSSRVTAKEIMQLLHHNPQWKISGTTLRIAESSLEHRAEKKDWLQELINDVALLQRKKDKTVKKTKESNK